jgi:hypothetical protein
VSLATLFTLFIVPSVYNLVARGALHELAERDCARALRDDFGERGVVGLDLALRLSSFPRFPSIPAGFTSLTVLVNRESS